MAVPLKPDHSLSGPPVSYNPELERVEIELLLEGVFRHYGFDFRAYAFASIRRRLWKRIEAEGLKSISELQALVLHEPAAMERLLFDLSVSVTAMFRDPGFYRVFRDKVVPLLRTYPFIRIWHAGCSTGEEFYATAIVRDE
jgi:chemotaxis protein methyltransferase CheR